MLRLGSHNLIEYQEQQILQLQFCQSSNHLRPWPLCLYLVKIWLSGFRSPRDLTLLISLIQFLCSFFSPFPILFPSSLTLTLTFLGYFQFMTLFLSFSDTISLLYDSFPLICLMSLTAAVRKLNLALPPSRVRKLGLWKERILAKRRIVKKRRYPF